MEDYPNAAFFIQKDGGLYSWSLMPPRETISCDICNNLGFVRQNFSLILFFGRILRWLAVRPMTEEGGWRR